MVSGRWSFAWTNLDGFTTVLTVSLSGVDGFLTFCFGGSALGWTVSLSSWLASLFRRRLPFWLHGFIFCWTVALSCFDGFNIRVDGFRSGLTVPLAGYNGFTFELTVSCPG